MSLARGRRRAPLPACLVGLVLVAAGAAKLAQQLGSAGGLFTVPAGDRLSLRQKQTRGGLLSRRAEDVEDPKAAIVDNLKKTLNVAAEKSVEAKFETPMDGLLSNIFGSGGGSAPAEDPDEDDFVDSSTTDSYVTVELDRPFGIGFAESDENPGASISELQPNSNAAASGALAPGYLLIAANGKPVHGLEFAAVVEELSSSSGPLKLTFFKGGEEFFYGKFGPSSQWLQDFLDDLAAAA